MADHTILWLTPGGAPAPLSGPGSVEDTVSHLDATRRAVSGKALGMGREAAALLSQHHKTGAAHIEVIIPPGPELDGYVVLADNDDGQGGPATSAMGIELGFIQTHREGKKLAKPISHSGLHILGRVMNRAARRYGG
jgi:hypothetical protein